MKLDYWNHPLVVSAFRVRFRGRAPSVVAMLYFLILLSLGGLLHYKLANDPKVSWILVYFVSLISIEIVVAALFASTATFQSMHNEVVQRTLDYQRTAALSPYEILLGKLLGEPVQGYILALAGVPLLVWCVAMGATSLPTLALLLLNLVTTTILFGAVGLIHPVDTTTDRSKAGGRSVRAVGFLILFIVSIQMVATIPILIQSPLGQAALGLLLPVVSIYGLAIGQPFGFSLNLFGLELPYLFVTPIVQVAAAALVIHSIARRLISPLNTALSKPTAYALLLAIDVLAASMLTGSQMISGERVVAGFCLTHLVAALLLTMTVTPGRETLKTWIWRFRGRLPWWQDMLWGPRSGNLGALAIFCLIGVVIAPVLALAVEGRTMIQSTRADLLLNTASMIGGTSAVLLGFGTLFQWLCSVSGTGGIMYLGTIAMFSVVPHLAGSYLGNDFLISMSPSGQFGSWLFDVPLTLPIAPLLLVYGAMFLIIARMNARRIALGIAAVRKKLAVMLADPAEVSAEPVPAETP